MKYTRFFLVLLMVAAMAFTGCMKSGGRKIVKKKKKADDPLAGMTFDDAATTELTWSKAAQLVESKGWTKTTSADGKDYPGEKVYETTAGSYKIRLKLMKKDNDTSDKLNLAKFEISGPSIILNSAEQLDPKIKDILNGLNSGFIKGIDNAIASYKMVNAPGVPRNTGNAMASNGWKCVAVNYTPEPNKGVTAIVTVERPFNPFD